MNNLLIAASDPTLLDAELAALGCEVVVLGAGPGVHDAAELCAARGIRPDLFIQREVLGPRTLFANLAGLGCPAVYWSLDTHLNVWWQGSYGRTFSRVLATQKDWLPALSDMGVTGPRWLPWFGETRAFRAHGERGHDVVFAGRITPERPARALFAEYLQSAGAHVVSGLSRPETLALFDDARIVPNETILGEVNWRIFEAASCGALSLTPAAQAGYGGGLDELFEPGREIVLYEDVLDLADTLRHYRARPREAQAIAAAGRDRVLAEHLPAHRAGALLDAARDAPLPPGGPEADVSLWLAAAAAFCAGILPVGLGRIVAGLGDPGANPDCAAALVRSLYAAGRGAEALVLAKGLLAGGAHEGAAGLNAAASVLCLRLGEFDAAKAYWYRQARAAAHARPAKPETPAGLLALWATELSRLGRLWRPGFPFDPAAGLPTTALECLLAARELDPGDAALTRRLEALLRGLPGSDYLRLGCLAEMTVREPDNWRYALQAGLLDLRLFREPEGLAEIDHARNLAAAKGEQAAFTRFMRGTRMQERN